MWHPMGTKVRRIMGWIYKRIELLRAHSKWRLNQYIKQDIGKELCDMICKTLLL